MRCGSDHAASDDSPVDPYWPFGVTYRRIDVERHHGGMPYSTQISNRPSPTTPNHV